MRNPCVFSYLEVPENFEYAGLHRGFMGYFDYVPTSAVRYQSFQYGGSHLTQVFKDIGPG